MWHLFNSFTEALKDGNLAELPERTEALHGLLEVAVGLNRKGERLAACGPLFFSWEIVELFALPRRRPKFYPITILRNMRVQTLFLFCVALISVTEILSGAVASKPSQKPMEQNTRLQIFLDNANFGPGKIDGRQGEFTKRALALFRQSKGLPQAVSHNPKAPLDMTGLDLSGIEPVFVSYTITADDAANVGELPKDPQGQAKMKRLPYATLAEAVAERFHCGIDFLKQFNPQKKNLAVGDSLTVPNVKPFELIETRIIE